MDYPFIQGISDIQDTEANLNSRISTALSPRSHFEEFFQHNDNSSDKRSHVPVSQLSQFGPDGETYGYKSPSFSDTHLDTRLYIQNALASWGLQLGYLPDNDSSRKTLKCILEMIEHRFKEHQAKQKLKSNISQLQFQNNKYLSLMDQAKRCEKEQNNKIGALQNNIIELKNKLKRAQTQGKKEKEQDRKMISMLTRKNQQITHEVKKKQQEVARVKEQMKRNVGEKLSYKSVNFQVFEAIPKTAQTSEAQERVLLLNQRFQAQRKKLLKQNLLLKEKLYEIRDQIVTFAEWIDETIFGSKEHNYKNKLIVNHNMLFRKECIVHQFRGILSDASSGIMQLIKMKKENMRNSQNRKQPETNHLKLSNNLKGSTQYVRSLQYQKKQEDQLRVNIQPKKAQQTHKIPNQVIKSHKQTIHKQQNNITSLIFDDFDKQSAQHEQISIVSSISMKDMLEKDKKFDKWDLLFHND